MTGLTRRGGADDVVRGALASLAGALEEEPHQVPAVVPARVLREARTAPAVQKQLERSPGTAVSVGAHRLLDLFGRSIFVSSI